MTTDLADAIDALLPQTQCTKCGFAGCRPYAEAIARGEADINRCPPGGAAGIARLAALLGRASKPLDPAHGTEAPPAVAIVDEQWCIGCTLCIQACPVDAIVGAPKRMHTVLLDECTGCELCVAPCPMDCIAIVPVDTARDQGFAAPTRRQDAWQSLAEHWRLRHQARQDRLARERRERDARLERKAAHKLASLPAGDPGSERKRAIVEAALARARARRASRDTPAT
jgi:electron transport complex protein RnfB